MIEAFLQGAIPAALGVVIIWLFVMLLDFIKARLGCTGYGIPFMIACALLGTVGWLVG
jgi:hypothetical protein